MTAQSTTRNLLERISAAKTYREVAECLTSTGAAPAVTGDVVIAMASALERAFEGDSDGGEFLVAGYFLLRDRPGMADTFPWFFDRYDSLVLMLAVDSVEPLLLRATASRIEGGLVGPPTLPMALTLAAVAHKLGDGAAVRRHVQRAMALGASPSELDGLVPGWRDSE